VLVYLVLTYSVAHSTLYVQGLVLVAAVFAVVALSLDLMLGVTGMFSLAHAGLLGVAAAGRFTGPLLPGASDPGASDPGTGTGLARVYQERPPAEPGTVAVTCQDVMYRYPTSEVRALNGIDITVTAGTIHGLIGPNGSGKSTLIDVISGRARPESGTVSVNGEAVSGRAFERARFGFMRTFQAATLVNDMSALANVVMGGYSRLPRSTAVLEPIADAGQNVRQLVQLAAVCVARPSTLVLDEPLAGLSVGEAAQVRQNDRVREVYLGL
jgi:branched-chain amino acid transport system permease protein